eukprot:1896646-Rhodomonas_salina.1
MLSLSVDVSSSCSSALLRSRLYAAAAAAVSCSSSSSACDLPSGYCDGERRRRVLFRCQDVQVRRRELEWSRKEEVLEMIIAGVELPHTWFQGHDLDVRAPFYFRVES